MKKYYRTILLGISVVLLASCQMNPSETIFTPFHSSDETLTTSVSQAMMNSKTLMNVPVHVEAHQGTVVLSGYVKTIRQSDTAGDIASKVPGVKTVENNLIVRK